MDDVMDQTWCCLACRWKGRFGQLMASDKVRCPACKSDDIHPADGTATDLAAYHGEIGPRQ